MNLKICFLAAASAISSITFGANADTNKETNRPKLSREEMRARGEARKAQIVARQGGKVRNTVNQRGKIVIINAQKEVPGNQITEPMTKLADFLKVTIEVKSAETADPMKARQTRDDLKANALLMVVSCDTCSEPLMVAPDGAWAIVNVKALGDKNIDSRLRKEVVRAFAYLCGGTKSQYAHPLTAAITDIRQLDLIEQADLPIDVLMRMTEYLKTLGVTPYEEATYRSACRQGWAPAPTNDIQKAIWEQVHTMPDKPITIKKNKIDK